MKWIVFIFLGLISVASSGQLLSLEALDTTKVFRSIESALINPNEVYRLDLSKQKLEEFPKEVFEFKNFIIEMQNFLQRPFRNSGFLRGH
jgi:hypothetical protein